MADFNDDIEAFREALRKTREVTEEDILAREGYAKTQTGILGKLESASKRRAEVEEKIYKQIEATFGKEEALANKRLRSQEKQPEAYERQVESMGYTIKSNGEFVKSTIELTNEQKKTLATLKDANEKAQKIAKLAENPGKELGELANRFKDSKAIVGDFSNKILDSAKHSQSLTATYQLAGAGLEGLYKATTVMTKSLYSGERGATVTAKAFSELTDSVGSMMQGIGAAATVLSIFLPIGRLLKIAAMGLTALGAGIKTYGEYQKLGAEQNKKLFDTYNKLSASGLQASKGLTGVFETVQTLGMTAAEIEKFTELLVSNSKELKLFGATAADGAKKYTEVAGALVKSDIGQTLEKMGITADEQREHTLRYMANQTRMGMSQGKTQQELIRGSQAYIEELDKIAMMTGATRKEQEEARAAVMAEENLRAAMLQAELDGDTKRQQSLKAIADYSTYLRASGDIRGSTGVANYGAMGGPVDEASAAAMITYGKGIEAALNGKPIAEVIKEGQKSADQTLKQMAGTRAVGGDVSGLVTGKYGNLLDTSKMNAEVLKAVGPNGDINAYLNQLQVQRAKADEKLNLTVEANRKQQDAAMMMDSVVFSKFNHAAQIQSTASNVFNSAVKTFSETVGAKPVTGGGYSAGGGGGAAPAAPAAPTAPTPLTSTGGGAATGNPNLTRQSSRARNQPVSPAAGQPSTATPVSMTPNAGATTLGSMAEQRKSGLAGAAQGTPTPLPSNMTPKMTDSILNFGSNSGSKSNFEQLSDSIRNRIITAATEFNSMTGSKISINSAKRDPADQQRIWDESVQEGRTGRTAQGRPIGKPGSSKHEHGLAVDIQNYNDPAAVKAMNSQGLFQTVPNDPVHFEMARFGGVFSGPESGYPVMMHGKTEIFTKPQFDKMNEGVKKESVTTAMQDLGSTTTTSTESPSAILQELLGLMENKFDAMIDKLSTGNDISDKLLRNSMV